jgi:hypothetical protein
MYVYLNVRSDGCHSRHLPSTRIRAFLATRPELAAESPDVFVNTPGRPWLRLSLLSCSPDGNFSSDGRDIETCNLVG